MNISSVSSTSTASVTTGSSDTSQLEAKKKTLETQLKQVNASKDDEKTKQAKIKSIEAQIQQIEAQIQQKQTNKTGVSANNTTGSGGEQGQAPKSGDANSVKEKSTENLVDVLV